MSKGVVESSSMVREPLRPHNEEIVNAEVSESCVTCQGELHTRMEPENVAVSKARKVALSKLSDTRHDDRIWNLLCWVSILLWSTFPHYSLNILFRMMMHILCHCVLE